MKTERGGKITKAVLTTAMTMALAFGVMLFTPARAMAAEKFDPVFYLMTYPDVGIALGENVSAEALYAHYVNVGMAEGRMAYAGAAGGEAVDGIADIIRDPAKVVVPIQNLPDFYDIIDSMSIEEFVEVYNELLPAMQMLVGTDQHLQVFAVTYLLADMYDSGDVIYSNATPQFSNPYGFVCYGAADSAGCTRTAGLMFEMLGIEWEHVVLGRGNMELYHWSVVTIDGQRYVVDPYMRILMPEESEYAHPGVDYIISMYG